MFRFSARPDGVLLALRVTSVLACLAVLYQSAVAGQIFVGDEDVGAATASGAVLLHVLTGLTTLAGFVHHRARAAPWWPTAVAAVVFVATFRQALVGPQSSLFVHVPLALALMIGATAVAVWALTTPPGPVAR